MGFYMRSREMNIMSCADASFTSLMGIGSGEENSWHFDWSAITRLLIDLVWEKQQGAKYRSLWDTNVNDLKKIEEGLVQISEGQPHFQCSCGRISKGPKHASFFFVRKIKGNNYASMRDTFKHVLNLTERLSLKTQTGPTAVLLSFSFVRVLNLKKNV